MRVWFARRVLNAAGADESLAVKLLEAAFDQLYALRKLNQWSWLKTESTHEVSEGLTDSAFQLVFDRLRLRKPRALYRCPDTGTLWPREVVGWSPLKGCLGNIAEHHRRTGRLGYKMGEDAERTYYLSNFSTRVVG